MSFATTSDGVRLFYESAGSGTPIIFVHEFGGSHWSWEPQLNFFARRHRCITFAARGFPPSDIPQSVDAYSQARAADDIAAVLDHLRIDRAHVVGLSMGGFATLHFGFHHTARALSLCVAGCGYGAEKGQQDKFRSEVAAVAAFLDEHGIEAFAAKYGCYAAGSYGVAFAPDGRLYTVADDNLLRRYGPGPEFKKEQEIKTTGAP